jgi:hypothetical protein
LLANNAALIIPVLRQRSMFLVVRATIRTISGGSKHNQGVVIIVSMKKPLRYKF